MPRVLQQLEETVELLDYVAESWGDTVAFVEADGERLTFGAWRAAADGVAAALADRGVAEGDVVCLLLPSSIRYMICYQAVMRLGAITSGINLRLGPSERAHIFASASPRVTIVDDPAVPLPPSGGTTVGWSELAAWRSAAPPPRPTLGAATRVLICWTSGTTGMPKGAVFDHANLKAIARGAGVLSEVGDRRLSPLPFPHVGTMTRPWDEISRRITTVITPYAWSAGEALRLMAEERVTVAQGVATQWELILRHPTRPLTDLSHLRVAGIGASRIPPDLIARMRETLGVPIIHRYASTEAALISGTRPEDPDRVVCETVGRPSTGVSIRVVAHDTNHELAPDEAGRVQVRSEAMMRGYWREPQASAEIFTNDGWLNVGDEGWFDDGGNLHLLGRIGEMYIRGGYNIYPVEVERVLAEHPGVEQVDRRRIARRDPRPHRWGVHHCGRSARPTGRAHRGCRHDWPTTRLRTDCTFWNRFP